MYLSGRNVVPEQPLYDDSWGEVILMSGLPGTGKDTWIMPNRLHMPVISLDDIRREIKIKPTDGQGIAEKDRTAERAGGAVCRVDFGLIGIHIVRFSYASGTGQNPRNQLEKCDSRRLIIQSER